MERQRIKVKAKSRPVLTIVPYERPVSDEILATLDTIMEMALSGSLKSVAIAGVHHDGAITTAYVTGEASVTLMGAISVVHHRLNRRFEEV